MDSYDSDENELYDSDVSMEEVEEEEESNDIGDMLASSLIRLQFDEIVKECYFGEEELVQNDPFFVKYNIESIKDLLTLIFEHFKTLGEIDVALSKEKWEEYQRNKTDKDSKNKQKKSTSLENLFDATQFWTNYFGSDNEHSDINLLYKEFKETIIFKFQKPTNMVLLGSYAHNTVSKPYYNVDVGIILPSSIWKEKDVKGHRYYMKRLLYLAVLEKSLHSSSIFNFKVLSKFAFKSIEEYNMPHLNISFHNKSKFSINIWPILDGESFKWSKLNPGKFHMHYMNSTDVKVGSKDPDSYFHPIDEKILDIWHNNDIASDILKITYTVETEKLFSHSKDFRDALIMLKLWSRKRNLYSKLNGFVLSMLIHYLLLSRHLTADMKAYEIFISVLKFLASDTIINEGIDFSSLESNYSLYENCGLTPPPELGTEDKSVWKELCEIVFLDRSGHVNFLCRHSKVLWLSIKQYAQESLRYVENESVESVNSLFLKKYIPFLESDLIIRLNNLGHNNHMEIEESNSQSKVIPQLSLDKQILRLLKIEKVLFKGLETRISCFKMISSDRICIDSKSNTYTETSFEWNINSPMNFLNENMNIILFLEVNSDNWKKLINHGPPAQSPQAPSFIEFWGKEKSGLRRFKDGQILHCSVWGDDDPLISSSMNYRHQIMLKIVQHLMKRHFNIESNSAGIITSFFDSLLLVKGNKNETEHSSNVNEIIFKNYNELETILSNLDISLSVKSVRGIGSVMRSTHPSPSLYNKLIDNQFLISKSNYHMISNICPIPIDVIVQLEPSSKWPDDLEGISALKTSFYFEMKESLLKQYNVKSTVSEKTLDIYFKGYVWRIDIYHPREIELIRRIDENESIKSNFHYKESTRVASLIKSLSIQHPSYAQTCKIIKSWLASQLLPLESFDDGILIDLIVAYLYMPQNEYHFVPPQHYVSGFLRALTLLGTHNWNEEPLIINFDNIFSSEDIDHIQREYNELREDLRPTIRIVYPGSEKNQPFYYQYPYSYSNRNAKLFSDSVLERIQSLAIKAKNEIMNIIVKFEEEKKIETIFSPPLTDFDIIILLNKNISYNYFRDKISNSSTPKLSKSVVEMAKSIHKDEFMPILPGFNPVKNFIDELDVIFGDRCFIYHDGYIGNIIGLVWKPSAFYITGGLKLNYLSHVLPIKRKKKSKSGAVINIFQILSDIKKCGEGIIKDIYFVSGSHNL